MANVQWDDAPASGGSVSWDDDEDSKTNRLLKGAKGVAAGVGDIAAGALKFPAQMGLGLAGTFSGERPDIARNASMQAVEDTFPSFGKDMHDNQAYHAIMYPFEKLSEGIDWAGNKLSSDPGMQGSIKQALDIGSLAIPGAIEHGVKSLKGKQEFPINRSSDPDLRAPEVEVVGKTDPPLDEDIPYLAGAEMGAEPRLGNSKVEWDDGEPTVGDTNGLDTSDPRGTGPTTPEVAPQKTEGYGQGELFTPENPYISSDIGLAVDDNGMPFREGLSHDISQAEYEQAPQGDLFKSREPTLESQLVPEAAQDVIPKGPEGVAPTAPDWTLSPARSKQLELLGHDYEPTTPGEIPRENQREPLSTNTDAGVPFKGQKLKYTGKNAEKRAKALTAEERAFQDALTRAVGDPIQTEMLGAKHPFANKQGGWIKMPGGQWHPSVAEKITDWLTITLPRDNPFRPHLNKTVKNYLNKYAGTERDPLKDVPIPMLGDTARWEDITDKVFIGTEASKYNKAIRPIPEGMRQASDYIYDPENRIPPNEKIWGMEHSSVHDEQIVFRDYMAHVGDYIREFIDPAEFDKYDFTRLVRETAAQDARQAKKMLDVRGSGEGTTLHKQYPDGMKWVEVGKTSNELPKGYEIRPYDDPSDYGRVGHKMVLHDGTPWSSYGGGSKISHSVFPTEQEAIAAVNKSLAEAALKNEGDVMGHCVGGYCEYVHSGHSKIYSLRDAKGMSHVTIEVNPRAHPMNARGMEVERWVATKIKGKAFEDILDIAQIKGKQNRAPADKYKPYVQDFVQSGEWGRVGDLQNAGMMDKKEAFNRFEDMINSNRSIPFEEKVNIKNEIKRELNGDERKYYTHAEIVQIDDKYNLFRTDKPINKGPGGNQSGAFDPSEIGKGLAKLFGKRSAKPELPNQEPKPKLSGPMIDQKRYLTADIRPVEQFIKEEAPRAKEWKDIRGVWDNLFPASNVSTLAAKHPAIKFIVDKALTADREARMAKENAKYGSTFAPKRGLTSKQFNRRVRSDDGALTILEKMPVKESEPAIRLWLDKYDGKDIPMTAESLAADGMNAKQTKMLLAIRNQFDSFLKKYNALAAKYPDRVTPMPVRPNYFPHFWKGDYRVIVRDAKDKSIFTEGVDTKYQAETVREELQKKFPDHKVEWKEAQTKFDLDNTDAFRQALSILDKDDPARKILQQSFEEILQKRGFRKQTLHREGVPGYLGSKAGKEGVGDAVTAIEMYLDRGYNFLANQQKKAAFSQMLKGLKDAKFDMQKATPNAYDYTSAFIDNSTGGLKNGLHLIDDMVESIGSKTGLGKSLGSNALSGANGLASAFWLTTPRFIAAQLVQPLYNLPKGMELKAVGITDKHVMPTFLKAYQETFFNPSPLTMKGMNWAKENGFIDSKIMDLMGAKFDSHAKTAKTLFQTFSKYSLGKWEQEVVRTPSFIFYDLLLRDAIPDDVQRWTTAGQLTDKYMVDYTKTDSPLAYGKMGILGDAVKPLKQFPHAYFGQMVEYMKDMGSEKTVKPLATFIGVQFLVSGLKGLMLLAEATLLINAWNNVFHTSVQTPDEFLKTHFGKDLTFGPLSTLTGMDMSGTLGAPQLGQMPSLPGAGFAYDAAKNVGQYAVNKVEGLDTEADKMKAIQSVTPNIAQGRVEEAFTKPGEGPPNPNNNMIPNLSPRSFSDKLARDLGGRSVRESSEMMGIRTLKASDAQRKEQRGQILDVMVDHLVEEKGIDKKLINRYVELGGNPENIADSIVLQLKNRTMTYAERYVGNLEGLSGAQKAQRLEQFRLTADQITDPDEMVILMKEIRNAK